jgi:hypothetical protein
MESGSIPIGSVGWRARKRPGVVAGAGALAGVGAAFGLDADSSGFTAAGFFM